jgi:hypothetical protein
MDSHDRTTDLDLEILDLLRDGPRSAYRLARTLSHKGESVDTEAVRSRLVTLASRSLVAVTPSGAADEPEEPRADPWKITGEGRHLVEPEEGVASGPYSRRPRRRLLGLDRDRPRDSGVRGVRPTHRDGRFIAVSGQLSAVSKNKGLKADG